LELERTGALNMKNDKYTKVVLTIIAICLLWVCLKDLNFLSPQLNAETHGQGGNMQYGTTRVYLEKCAGTAFSLAEPILVQVANPDEFVILLNSLVEKNIEKAKGK
jgi:hypothetical protein